MKNFFEDLKRGETLTLAFLVREKQVDEFLKNIGEYYKQHMDELKRTYGSLVPPHMIPGIIAEESMKTKEYPNLALAGFNYNFLRPVRTNERYDVEDRITILENRPSKSYGRVVISRTVKDSTGQIVIRADIDHRVKKKQIN